MILIIWGPRSCGKTRNARALTQAYALSEFIDEWNGKDALKKDGDYLVLTSVAPPYKLGGLNNAYIMPFDAAMKPIEVRNRALDELRKEKDTKIAAANEVVADMADVKQRLFSAELTNAEMRGYLKRVREEDVNSSELVKTGEPDHNEMLVPKWPATHFATPEQLTYPARRDEMGMSYIEREEHRNRKPKCWINYDPTGGVR